MRRMRRIFFFMLVTNSPEGVQTSSPEFHPCNPCKKLHIVEHTRNPTLLQRDGQRDTGELLEIHVPAGLDGVKCSTKTSDERRESTPKSCPLTASYMCIVTHIHACTYMCTYIRILHTHAQACEHTTDYCITIYHYVISLRH